MMIFMNMEVGDPALSYPLILLEYPKLGLASCDVPVSTFSSRRLEICSAYYLLECCTTGQILSNDAVDFSYCRSWEHTSSTFQYSPSPPLALDCLGSLAAPSVAVGRV